MPDSITIGAGGGTPYGIVEQVSGTILAGQTGAIFTASIADPVANPDDMIVLYLLSGAGNTPEVRTSLSTDNGNVWEDKTLTDISPANLGDYGVVRGFSTNSNTSVVQNHLKEVVCKSFTIEKVAGTTANPILYAYEVRRPIS